MKGNDHMKDENNILNNIDVDIEILAAVASARGGSLNDLTQLLRDVWADVDKEMRALNLTSDIWLEDHHTDVFAIYRVEVHSSEVFREGWSLGFARLDDDWSVLCRRVAIEDCMLDGDGPEVIAYYSPQSILDADPIIQLEATSRIGSLLQKAALISKTNPPLNGWWGGDPSKLIH
jgi:hypothetical protein